MDRRRRASERLRGDNARRGGSILPHRHFPRRLAERVSETSRARWRLARRRRWARRPPRGPPHSGVTSWRVAPPPGARRPVASSPRATPRARPAGEPRAGTSSHRPRRRTRRASPPRPRARARSAARLIAPSSTPTGAADHPTDPRTTPPATPPASPKTRRRRLRRRHGPPRPPHPLPPFPPATRNWSWCSSVAARGGRRKFFPTSSSSAVPWRPRPRRRGERSARTPRRRTSNRDSDSPATTRQPP